MQLLFTGHRFLGIVYFCDLNSKQQTIKLCSNAGALLTLYLMYVQINHNCVTNEIVKNQTTLKRHACTQL